MITGPILLFDCKLEIALFSKLEHFNTIALIKTMNHFYCAMVIYIRTKEKKIIKE